MKGLLNLTRKPETIKSNKLNEGSFLKSATDLQRNPSNIKRCTHSLEIIFIENIFKLGCEELEFLAIGIILKNIDAIFLQDYEYIIIKEKVEERCFPNLRISSEEESEFMKST